MVVMWCGCYQVRALTTKLGVSLHMDGEYNHNHNHNHNHRPFRTVEQGGGGEGGGAAMGCLPIAHCPFPLGLEGVVAIKHANSPNPVLETNRRCCCQAHTASPNPRLKPIALLLLPRVAACRVPLWVGWGGVGVTGARLWDVQPYYGISLKEICSLFDTVYVLRADLFSMGLIQSWAAAVKSISFGGRAPARTYAAWGGRTCPGVASPTKSRNFLQ